MRACVHDRVCTPANARTAYSRSCSCCPLPPQIKFLSLHGKAHKIMVYFLTCACVDFHALALARLGPKLLPGVQVCFCGRAAGGARALWACRGRAVCMRVRVLVRAAAWAVRAAEVGAGLQQQVAGRCGGRQLCTPAHVLPCALQVKALHGRMKQAVREVTLEAFTQLPAGKRDRGGAGGAQGTCMCVRERGRACACASQS